MDPERRVEFCLKQDDSAFGNAAQTNSSTPGGPQGFQQTTPVLTKSPMIKTEAEEAA